MKICIDGLGANRLQGTGLYTYTYELINNLLQIYPQPQYHILWDGNGPVREWRRYRNLVYINLPVNRRTNDYSALEYHISNNEINIYHSPNNGLSIPVQKSVRCIMTVHDLSPLSCRDYADSKYCEKFLSVFPDAVKRCDKIIAVSDFIKGELVRLLQVPPEKIAVIYPGCSIRFSPMEKSGCRSILKDKYNITGDYILYSGSIHCRKNLPVLFKAFKKALHRIDNCRLVVAGKIDGKREEYFNELKELAGEIEISNYVVYTGTVDYQDMPYLYNGAKCAVNLSAYEGFSVSPIEAMACGIPVICSDTLFYKEAAGDGAVYVKGEDDEELAKTIIEAVCSRSHRERIVEKGMHQSKKYRWDSSIKRLISVYESIA